MMTDVGGFIWIMATFAVFTPACEAVLVFTGWIVNYFADPR